MPRIALTGGSGFIGAVVARPLLRRGHAVHLLLRPGHGDWRLSGMVGAHLLEADLASAARVRDVLQQIKPDWVFNLAAHGAYSWQADVEEMWQTNVELTRHLLAAALEVGCSAFVQAGSSSEYGFRSAPPLESEAPMPNSDYAVTKAAATLQCVFAGQRLAAPTTVLRLYSVYGPWEEPARLVPTLLVHALEGRLPPLADPGTARDSVYVDDVADAFLRAAESAAAHRGAIYNVGTGRQTTLADLVEIARAQLGVSAQPRWGSLPSRAWDTSTWVSDPSLIRADLGWAATTSLGDGLARTAEWLREDGDRLAFYRRHLQR